MKQIENLLNVIFELIDTTSNLDDSMSKELVKSLSEDSMVMGFKLNTTPLNNLISNLDKYLDKYEDFEKYPHAGGNLSYCIYEKNIFIKDRSESSDGYAITYDDGRKYYINNQKDSVYYFMKEIIPDYIENTIKKNNGIDLKEIEIDIASKFMDLLFVFHKETITEINSFTKFIEYYLNTSSETLNNISIQNLERNLEDKLYMLNQNAHEDIFYDWIYEYQYGSYLQDFKLPKNQDEMKENNYTFEIKNKFDFYKWFLFYLK